MLYAGCCQNMMDTLLVQPECQCQEQENAEKTVIAGRVPILYHENLCKRHVFLGHARASAAPARALPQICCGLIKSDEEKGADEGLCGKSLQ